MKQWIFSFPSLEKKNFKILHLGIMNLHYQKGEVLNKRLFFPVFQQVL